MILDKLSELEQNCLARAIPIISKEKAKLLLKKIQQLKPKRILELGTAIGYSGIILGSEGAELTTIELNPRAAEEAVINFAKFNINAQIIIGDGVEIVKDLVKNKQSYDLIFIDFYLQGYHFVLEDCIKLLKDNGVIIADNVNLEVQRKDKIINCQDFKKAILNHPQLKTEIIEIGDGISISQKV